MADETNRTEEIIIPSLEEALQMDPMERLQEIQSVRQRVVNGEDVPRALLQRALVLIDAHNEATLSSTRRNSSSSKSSSSKRKKKQDIDPEKLLDDLFD